MSVSELSDDDTSLELPADGESQTKEGKKVTQGGLWNGVFCNESDSDTNEKSKSDSNTAPHDSIILLNAIEERKWSEALKYADCAAGMWERTGAFNAALKVSCKLNEAWSETAKHNIQLVEGDYFPIAERVNGNRCYKKTVPHTEHGDLWICFAKHRTGKAWYIQADSDRGQAHGFVYRYVRPLENHNGRRFTINAPHELSNWLLFDGTRWLQTRGSLRVTPIMPVPLLRALALVDKTPTTHLAVSHQAFDPSSPTGTPPRKRRAVESSKRTLITKKLHRQIWKQYIFTFLANSDIGHLLTTNHEICRIALLAMAYRAEWRLILSLIEADPNAARRRQQPLAYHRDEGKRSQFKSGRRSEGSSAADEAKERAPQLPRDIASERGAPFNVLRKLVELTPYATLLEATEKNAHGYHIKKLVSKWPLTQALHRVGLNPDVIGKIVCDRSLGLTSEADLLHLEYADIVKAGATVVRARKVMSVLQNQRRQLLTEQERVPPSTPLSQTSSTLLRSTPTSVSPVTSDLLLQTNELGDEDKAAATMLDRKAELQTLQSPPCTPASQARLSVASPKHLEAQLSRLVREVQRVTHVVEAQSLQIKQLSEVTSRMLEHQLRTLPSPASMGEVENSALKTIADHHAGECEDSDTPQKPSSGRNPTRKNKKRRRAGNRS